MNVPTVNLPANVRFALYILTALGTALVAYAKAEGYIGENEVALWASITVLSNGMAAFNTTTQTDDSEGLS